MFEIIIQLTRRVIGEMGIQVDTRSIVALAIAASAASCTGWPSVAPGEAHEAPVYRSEFVRSEAVEHGRASGVVVSSETGEALRGVQVWIIGTSSGTISREDGSFDLEGVPEAETLRVAAALIGYRTDTLRVEHRAGAGLAGRIVLIPGPICMCVDPVGEPEKHLFVMDVRDAVNRRAPGIAELRVSWRGGEAADRAEVGDDSRLVLAAGPRAEGRYTVSVVAPGYQLWSRTIVVKRGCCGDLRPRRHVVWLLPLSRTG